MVRRLYAVAAAVVAVAVFYLAWPAQLGGGTNYVVTSGVSMEPRFHSGDLAILRPADDYQVGQIVGYRSRSLRVTVLHRIVDQEGGQFVFKGDNNTWLDVDKPGRADIVGRLVVRIPHGGVALKTLSQPAVLLLAGGLVTVAGARPRRRRPRRRRDTSPGSGASRLTSLSLPWPEVTRRRPRAAALAAAISALAFLLIAGLAWTVPARGVGLHGTPIEHRATLSYQASVVSDAAYPSGKVQLPDPVFLRLVPDLDVTVEYNAVRQSQGLTAVVIGGSYEVSADVVSPNGWHRSFVLEPRTSFVGESFHDTARLPLGQILQAINDVERLTGVAGGPYSLAVTTAVLVSERQNGRALTENLSPALTFDMDPTQLRLREKAAPGASAVTVTQEGSVTVAGATPSRLPPPVFFAISAGALAFCAAAFICAALLIRLRPSPLPTPAATFEIPRHYRRRVVATRLAAVPPDRTVMVVDSMDTLHRIAERYERLIFHDVSSPIAAALRLAAMGAEGAEPSAGSHRSGQAETFLVDDDTAIYLFVTDSSPRSQGQANEPVRPQGRVPLPRHASRMNNRR